MANIRVLVADDHRLMSEGVKALLSGTFDVVGTAADGEEMVGLAASLRPDVVVADLGMPKLDGVAAMGRLKDAGVPVRVVILSMREEMAHVRRALASGAAGYVLKHAAPDELAVAIRAAAAGQVFVSPALMSALLQPDSTGGVDDRGVLGKLSERQLEVLRLFVKGMTAPQIAETLGIVTRTVEFHKYRVMELLGARTSADLIRIALQAGISLE
jgi:DNA-binding NarL/FixJ family response regulator